MITVCGCVRTYVCVVYVYVYHVKYSYKFTIFLHLDWPENRAFKHLFGELDDYISFNLESLSLLFNSIKIQGIEFWRINIELQ